MSSILKALKKAEQENKSRSSLKLNVRTTLNSRMQHQRQRFLLSQKGLIFLLGVGLVIASASYILFFPDKTIQPEPSPRVIQPQSYSMAPVKKEDQKTPDQPSIVDSQTPPADAGQKVADHKMESLPPVVEEVLPPQEQDIKKKASEQVSQPLSKPDPKEEILPLKDGILSIQAISWAKNPSDRIAVINTKIVGEGESVQGYGILEIGKDEVIVRLSDQKFRLTFKYR